MKSTILFFKRIFILKYFILGISIAFLINMSGSCSKDNDDSDIPDIPGNDIEIPKINEGAKAVETAFISGDVNAIKGILTDNAEELYGTGLTQVNKNHLVKLGEALKSRNLKVNSDLYAEYNYTKDGITYTIAMAKQDDGSWKLMRF